MVVAVDLETPLRAQREFLLKNPDADCYGNTSTCVERINNADQETVMTQKHLYVRRENSLLMLAMAKIQETPLRAQREFP